MDVLPAPIDPVPDPWPVSGLVLRTPRLELRPDDDSSVRELVAMAQTSGIHPADRMPFLTSWTETEPRLFGRKVLQYFWSTRAETSPEDWSLLFVVRAGGTVIGLQELAGKRFGVLREVRTGSYLGLPYQGTGYGTEMRAAVLAFAFDHLGATTARSEYMDGNAASAGVSARLGYVPDGTALIASRDRPVVEHRQLLARDAFARPGWELRVGGYTGAVAGFLDGDLPPG
ncbi:GNAT family N-acetyltransferase [Pseudonocardia sp. HH130630-07]|uniref:GNAT family N-acetyltransferase n=1 Tax=Pseudonocardia sp. HH130630-07 TaxID=1690815 RepID=UPI000814C170|nr:GNAT family protein [Pseudonocardia sp. HH130630-07]ANY09948.1 GCN5 family acetyltransferase [Pseudonocardia sp. HH130630-07]